MSILIVTDCASV